MPSAKVRREELQVLLAAQERDVRLAYKFKGTLRYMRGNRDGAHSQADLDATAKLLEHAREAVEQNKQAIAEWHRREKMCEVCAELVELALSDLCVESVHPLTSSIVRMCEEDERYRQMRIEELEYTLIEWKFSGGIIEEEVKSPLLQSDTTRDRMQWYEKAQREDIEAGAEGDFRNIIAAFRLI